MEIDPRTARAAPGAGPAAAPRASASVILLRDAARGPFELLLVKRSDEQRFMAGVWVFPGGAVDPRDGTGEQALRAAAVRELHEEAGIAGLPRDELVAYSRWITPEHIATRFDTSFFLAHAAAGAQARPDGVECVDARWLSPRSALEAHAAGRLQLVFPTIRHLEQLAGFRSVAELVAVARATPVRPVLPRLLLSGGVERVVLPGEPGYEHASMPASH